MSSTCQKSVLNSALLVNLIHSVIDFEGACYCLHLASNLDGVIPGGGGTPI